MSVARPLIKVSSSPEQRLLFIGSHLNRPGNVSYEVPSLHPCFGIPVEKQDVGPHHPDFEHAAGQPEALEAAMTFAYLLAATGVDILQDSTKRKDMWAEHRLRFGSAC